METHMLVAQMKKQVQSQLANQLVAQFKQTELCDLRKFIKQQLFVNQQSLIDDSKKIMLVMQKAHIIISNLSLSTDAQHHRTTEQALLINAQNLELKRRLKFQLKQIQAFSKGPLVEVKDLQTKLLQLKQEFSD